MEGRPLELEPLEDSEREWLLDGLAVLIRRRGFAQFVSARILRPTSEDFPDAVPKGPQGARVLIRRLLRYAGMPDHRVRVQIYSERTFSEFDQHGMGHAGPGTAAWFAGIEGNVCDFGVNARELRDQEELIGTLGHEVAHAFRHHHALNVRDAEVEERLTDLTAVYLGFGSFLLNSSAVFKTGGYSPSGEPLLYQKEERGYLSSRQIALLLAAQVVARGLDRKQRAAVASDLAPNHRKLFEDACEQLPPPSDLRKRLDVPEPSSWRPWPDADGPVQALEPDDDDRDDAAPEEPPPPRAAAHRIESNFGSLLAIGGGVLPFVPGAIGLIEGWPLLGTACIAATLGYLVGSRTPADTCSNCRARLPRALSRCPGCTAQIVASDARLAEQGIDEEAALGEHASDGETEEDQQAELQLISAMYAAWAIERGHVSADIEEQYAELIVAVRCGERCTDQLAQAWRDFSYELTEPAATFVDDYFTRRDDGATTDYRRLLSGGALNDTPAAYQRVADLLDSRLREWSTRQ